MNINLENDLSTILNESIEEKSGSKAWKKPWKVKWHLSILKNPWWKLIPATKDYYLDNALRE